MEEKNQNDKGITQDNEINNSEKISPGANGGKKKRKKRLTFSDKCKALVEDRRSWKKRLVIAILASLAFTYTLFVYGPFEVYIKNISYYTFSFNDLMWPIILLGLGIFAVLTIIMTLLRGKIFNYVISAVFSTTLCSYVQCYFLKNDLGSLDGSAIKWEEMTTNVIINLAIWAVIFLIPYVIQYFSHKLWRRVVTFVSALLIIMQSAGLIELFVKNDLVDVVSDGYLSNSTIYEVSPQDNVIVFLLDRFAYSTAENLFAKYPDIKDKLSGFTYYDNACGSYSRTFPSVTYFLTGVKCNYDIPITDYFKKAWLEGTFLKDINEAGYETKVYTEVNYVIKNVNNAKGKIDNIGAEVRKANVSLMLESMIDLSAFRYSPLALKPFFWCYTGDLESITSSGDSAYASDIHSTNDPAFYQNLVSNGINVKDGSKGSFVFYHMRGSHDPYVMDEKGNRTNNADVYTQTAGNMNMIFEYIEQLKAQGIYDNTTIIITADHGITGTIEELEDMRSIALMVKPKGADTAKPIEYNSAPVSHDNIRSTILKALEIDYSNYGPALDEIAEGADITRYFYMSGSDAIRIHRDHNLITYEIKGDIKDFKNWKIVSKERIEYPFYDSNT